MKRAAALLLFTSAFLTLSTTRALANNDPPQLTITPSISASTFPSNEWISFKANVSGSSSYGNVIWTTYNGSGTLGEQGGQTRYPRGQYTVKATACKISDPKDCLTGTYSFTTTNSMPDTPELYMTPSEHIGRYTKVYFAHDVTKDIDGDDLTFEWKLDNNAWSNFPPNGIFTSGEHTVSIRARDTSHVYSEVGTKTFSILNAPPTKPIVVTSPKTNIRTVDEVTFNAFSSDFDRDTFTFEWKVDDGEWTNTKPKMMLSRGQHIVFVKATDSKGNHSQIGYTIFDVINTAPSAPKITIESTPGPTAITPVTLKAHDAIDVDGDDISYQIKVDNGEWQTSPHVNKFTRGDHTVYARAVDSLGAYSEVSSKKLKIENTRPTQPMLETHLGPLGISSEEISFIASGATDLDADPLSYFWKVDDGQWSNVAPNGKFKKGEHTVYVRAADNYNGVSDEVSSTFMIKNSAPTSPIIIINPTELTTTSIIEFVANDAVDYDEDPLTYEWNLDNTSWISTPPNGSLSIGNHTISVRVKDNEGLYSPVATSTFTVQKAAPSEPTLTLSPSESITTDTKVVFSAYSTSAPNTFLTYYWSVDNGAWSTTAPNGTFSEGEHSVSVQTKDSDGMTSKIKTQTFTVAKTYNETKNSESFEGVNHSGLTFTGYWTPTTLTSSVGSHSLSSGVTAHNKQTTASVQFVIPEGVTSAEVSFDFLVRSELNKDVFNYSVDGVLSKSYSGFGTWSQVITPLQSGTHTLSFTYKKDGANSLYDDAAFIDNFTVRYQEEKQ